MYNLDGWMKTITYYCDCVCCKPERYFVLELAINLLAG